MTEATISIRLEGVTAATCAGQLDHDFRRGAQPDYVDGSRSAHNSAGPPTSLAHIRKFHLDLRARTNPHRQMKSNAMIATRGVLTFSKAAQTLLPDLDAHPAESARPPEERSQAAQVAIQNRARLEAALFEVARHYNVALLYTAIHLDENAPHVHFMFSRRCLDGTIPKIDYRELQDLAAEKLRLTGGLPEASRGKPKAARKAAGEDPRTWINRRVRELHNDLPREIAEKENHLEAVQTQIAAQEDALEAWHEKIDTLQPRLEALTTKQAESGLTAREEKRRGVYTRRLEGYRTAQAEIQEQLADLKSEAQRLARETEEAATLLNQTRKSVTTEQAAVTALDNDKAALTQTVTDLTAQRDQTPWISARSPGGSPVPQAVRMPPGRARYPFRAGSPGTVPCSLRSPATAPARRSRSRTGRSRLGGRRLPSSSATVGIRTGDIASRSPPSRARSARTIPRAPVRSVLPFPLRRTTPGPAGWRTTTPGPAGWRTTTPGILALQAAHHPEALVPGLVHQHHADIPAGDGGGPRPRPPQLREQPVHVMRRQPVQACPRRVGRIAHRQDPARAAHLQRRVHRAGVPAEGGA